MALEGAGKKRVIVAMSGGVDSSVAALMLLQQGYEVQGMFMNNWQDEDNLGDCPAAVDLESAAEVCAALEIPLHRVNFARQYREQVFSRFVREYESGRTPNPDVLCNREIKFGAFLKRAQQLGAERIATGHYARCSSTPEVGWSLLKGSDRSKDQSYFLHLLNQEQLASCLFPLATMDKAEVRKLAEARGLHNHGRKDSTGICFIGERRMEPFLRRYVNTSPGPMRTLDGTVVGQHAGLCFYTIGQRQGLGLGGRAGAPEEPWYVAAKSRIGNELTVVQGHDHPALFSDEMRISELHWISGRPPSLGEPLAAKIRYRQSDQPCSLETLKGGECVVRFDRPQRAAAPGQSIVFYRGAACLGGGILEAAWQRRGTELYERFGETA